LHELLITMIFDWDSQFIFLVWNTICKMLKIKAKLFIAFHSKTNEQSEILNQKMKRYLRAYVNHQQDDWANWLSMIEYVSNASVSVTTQVFSFLTNYDFESRMSFDLNLLFDENTVRKRVQRFRDREIVFTMEKIWTFAKEHMEKNQQNPKYHSHGVLSSSPGWREFGEDFTYMAEIEGRTQASRLKGFDLRICVCRLWLTITMIASTAELSFYSRSDLEPSCGTK
jgi:hypothetical protein